MSEPTPPPSDSAPAEDAALVEQAYLDIRRRGAFREGLKVAREVAARATENPRLRARALHVLGHAQSRLHDSGRAVASLLESAALYEQLGDTRGLANVYDTIGATYATRGRLEQALHYYALSLVDKAVAEDRKGLAVTIGNVGRLQLRAGRHADAIRCFERDLAMSAELGDVRGQARMHEDLGRAWAGLDDFEKAEQHLAACLELATAERDRELLFYGHLDRAALRLRQDRVEDAERDFDAAAAVELVEVPYFSLILETVRGEILFARDDPGWRESLARALDRLSHADLPDVEIPARLRLARRFTKRGMTGEAERMLLQGLRRARRAGHLRYLPALNEEMTALRVVEGADEEEGRERRTREEARGLPADGAYVLLEHLGHGAYGEVYRAYDPQRAREVALKVVHLERRYDGEVRRRLLDSVRTELEAASRVRHPGVARVHAIGTERDGGLYVVQEFVAGRSLRSHMEEDAEPDTGRVLEVAARLAHALAALHGAGVVHRDVKPENVILREDGTPVLVDFGIAHVATEEGALATIDGTVEYMAPEQAAGGAVDGRADLYALGAVMFEWLVGFRPLQLQELEAADRVARLQEVVPPRVREFRPDVPEGADALIADLLAKTPEERPEDATAVAGRCRALGESEGPAPAS